MMVGRRYKINNLNNMSISDMPFDTIHLTNSPEDYFHRKVANKIYISRQFENKNDVDGSIKYCSRIATEVFNTSEFIDYYKIKDEILLRVTSGKKQQITLSIIESSNKVYGISCQKFTIGSGNPRFESFSFTGKEVDEIIKTLNYISTLNLRTKERTQIRKENLETIHVSQDIASIIKQLSTIQNKENLGQIISEVTNSENLVEIADLVTINSRKKSLVKFGEMLSQDLPEPKWQSFFQNNQWIFGYGLDYRFVESHNREVQAGYGNIDFASFNKFSVLVEIKLPKTELLKKHIIKNGEEKSPNRSDSWSLHNDFIDAISQVLGYKANWIIESRSIKNSDFGDFMTLDPKVILVIGRLDSLQSNKQDDYKNNRIKVETFELFRRNNRNIEIITYDELYERAKFIVGDIK
jgi:Domain of unknown function (DUF4263)